MAKAVSIIIPAYKEKENIGPLLERIHNSLSKLNYEVIIVDDNRVDGSEELVGALAKKYPVKIIIRKDKRGLSSAVMDGIASIDSQNVIVMDADLQHPPEVLPDIVKALETHDFVMASRYIKGGSPGEWKLSRKIVSKVATLLAIFIARKVKDPISGFFGFRRSVVDTSTLSPTGWKIGLEILVRSKFKNVTEVPFTFSPRARGESTLSSKIMTEYVKQLFSLYSYKYPILDFMIVGGIGTVINLGLYSILVLVPALQKVQYNVVGTNYYFPPFILSSLVAICSNYLMNKAWTFKGWKEKKGGFARYLTMGVIALVPDSLLLIAFVKWAKLPHVLAAALAIFINFIFRFLIARSWVWKNKATKTN